MPKYTVIEEHEKWACFENVSLTKRYKIIRSGGKRVYFGKIVLSSNGKKGEFIPDRDNGPNYISRIIEYNAGTNTYANYEDFLKERSKIYKILYK